MRSEERGTFVEDQLRRRAFMFAGRRSGTVRAMALLRQELDRIDNLEEVRREEILNPRNLPPILSIDEVGPPSSPPPTPRFARLSCLKRQRAR